MRNPFRYFNSSPEVIRLVVMMYIRYPLSLRQVEELLEAVTPRGPKYVDRTALLDDLAEVHKNHPVGDFGCEPHLVSDHHHGHALVRELFHDLKHFAEVADRVIFMDFGQIVEEGIAVDIFRAARSDRLKQFLDTWRARNTNLPT